MSTARATACHYCPRWLTAVWLSLGLLALVLAGGCRKVDAKVPETSPKSRQATITGTVRGSEGSSPMAGRTLAIIDVATGQRTVVRTSSNGEFSVAVPAGRYRLEMSLNNGETLIKRPGLVDVDQGRRDANIEVVVGSSRVARPRGPAYRLDNGLGSPIA